MSSLQWMAGALALSTLLSCGKTSERKPDSSRVQEEWDTPNRPQNLSLDVLRYEDLTHELALKGALDERPWQDDYWPFDKKGIARRYITQRDFSNVDEQIADAVAFELPQLLSASEKYDLINGDGRFTLTRESWHVYNYFFDKYGAEGWDWMGICSGWAPAALAEPAPQRHVLARNAEGKEVLFFAGDLRALMSKVYDTNKMSTQLRSVGMRCDEKPAHVRRDALGRPIDGFFTKTGSSFTILRDFAAGLGVMQISDDPTSQETYWLVAPAPLPRLAEAHKVYVYTSREDVSADLQERTIGKRARDGELVDVRFQKGCRDINPASLHLALVQMLSDAAPEKRGFVLETSRHDLVWNYPMWGFKSSISQPIPVTKDDPRRRAFRAPGTAYIADVTTEIIYVTGPVEPSISYPSEPSYAINWQNLYQSGGHYAVRHFTYSLEFDANGFVIGGEWHEEDSATSRLPDFLWRNEGLPTDESKHGGPSVIKYSLVKQLVDCSVNGQEEVVVPALLEGEAAEVSAVRCAL